MAPGGTISFSALSATATPQCGRQAHGSSGNNKFLSLVIFHIQGVFNLPGRGFRQRITLTSSVPMTLNDIIVHMRQFVIALVFVDGCSSFPDPDGFFFSVIGTDEVNVIR